MGVADIIALAEAAAKLVQIVRSNVETGKDALQAHDLATLRAILDPIHEQNLAIAKSLDEALAAAERVD